MLFYRTECDCQCSLHSSSWEDPNKLGPNVFTAGSNLTLNCTVKGHSGGLTYAWSVTGNPATPDCTGCNIDTSSTTSLLALGRPALYSYFPGVYTCTVSESGRPDSGNNNDFTVTVVGKFCVYFKSVHLQWHRKIILNWGPV